MVYFFSEKKWYHGGLIAGKGNANNSRFPNNA